MISVILLSAVIVPLCVLLLYQLTRGAVFVPSHKQVVAKMVELSEPLAGKKVADLGSGDGRILISMAIKGAFADGYEINPLLVLISRMKIKKLGLGSSAKAFWGDFWNVNLGSYDVVTLFGIDYIMNRLEKKLLAELKPGTLVLSNAFEFPNLKKVNQQAGINVYRI